jgi:hypothetical protein
MCSLCKFRPSPGDVEKGLSKHIDVIHTAARMVLSRQLLHAARIVFFTPGTW